MKKRILHSLILVCSMLFTAVFGMMTFHVDADAVIYKKEVSFNIEFAVDDEAVPEMPFSLYPVGYMDWKTIILRGDFEDLPVDFGTYQESDLIAAAKTLEAYVRSMETEPVASGVTDEEGKLTLSDPAPEVIPGVYLLMADRLTTDNYYFRAAPMLVVLPGEDERGEGIYSETICPKGEKEIRYDKKDISVMKLWKDEGASGERPASVTAVLLQDREVYETVTLSRENNWQYAWNNLDERYTWTIIEKDVPEGYEVSIEEENGLIVITNKKEPEEPTEESTTEEEPTEGTTEPTSDTEETPSEETTVPSEESTTVTETTVPETTKKEDKPSTLPVTGQLWWPVVLFAGLGFLFCIIGILRHRKEGK